MAIGIIAQLVSAFIFSIILLMFLQRGFYGSVELVQG